MSQRTIDCGGEIITTRQPLRIILCRLSEKGRKEIEKIEEEMKERDGRKRNRNEMIEREDIKTFPIPLLASRIASVAQL